MYGAEEEPNERNKINIGLYPQPIDAGRNKQRHNVHACTREAGKVFDLLSHEFIIINFSTLQGALPLRLPVSFQAHRSQQSGGSTDPTSTKERKRKKGTKTNDATPMHPPIDRSIDVSIHIPRQTDRQAGRQPTS
mmetsp:Transcript_29812/g.58513  ORF Transcript_29812/g.58513 Transcript_29812/m.58513 type:complete len:135 (-) Transcript_29812:1314-1718(-)